jgi:glycosyltransferase involved in cell wall biosynthesis
MRPFWRLAYIVLRRSEPVIARSSVIPLIPEDAFSSPASPDSDAPRPSEPMEQQPAAGEHFDAARVQSTKEPLPLAPDAMAAFNALQSVPGRKLVLVAADAPPMFDKHAGGLRLYNTVRIICEMGWSVVFASEAAREKFNGIAGSVEDRKRYERLLYDAGVEQIVYGAEETEALLRAIGDRLRWAFLSFALVAEQLIPKVRIHAPWATVIYDMVDFHALRMHREAQLTSNTNLKAAADRMHAVELMNARTADVTVAVSEAERQALLEIEPNLVVDVIPTVFDIPPGIRLDIDGRSGLLYVGGFWHTPNVDAVLWFVREVWPLIRRERPDMIFRVAGSNPSDEILALRGQPGIEVLGYVPDLTDLFATSRMSVAPLRYGAGVKGKVGQSMVYGLPVVATSVGAEGMAIENGKHILVADTPEEFAAAVLRLASDDDLWRTLQKNGRHFIEGAQSLDVLRNTLKALMNV